MALNGYSKNEKEHVNYCKRVYCQFVVKSSYTSGHLKEMNLQFHHIKESPVYLCFSLIKC